MAAPIRILVQTTIPTTDDDWSIARFSRLTSYLAALQQPNGEPLVAVTGRDRQPDADGNDPVLSGLDRAQFDELWLFALDVGDGLSARDCEGIRRFHAQGGGILTTRDHQDMGISMCALEPIGRFHYFNSRQRDPDPERCANDDCYTTTISFPNYHSGRNGDYQTIHPAEPLHPLLKTETGVIQFFPAHPHEGGVGVPADIDYARVIATGKSLVTDRPFNLAVAAEPTADAAGNRPGRIVTQSTFHHFVDYNWDIEAGCPSFVSEPPGDGYKTHPEALEDIKHYVRNLALWLMPDA
ncbi:MAG TPA: hypothetical protein V6C88_11185 [Chroococcidiopsis sp.]